MKRLLIALLLFTVPAFSQERPRRLWLSFELAHTATSPTANSQRPFGNNLFGITLEQQLPCRLSVVTGYQLRSFNACIPDPQLKTRVSWTYSGIGYSRSYSVIPLHLRWRLPIVSWSEKNSLQPARSMFYITPHAGVGFNIGRPGSFFGESEVSEESVQMLKRPADFFVAGETGVALGLEFLGLIRVEPFVAYTFREGRSIDFSLKAPYSARTYSRYNTFQAGLRIAICLIDWKRTPDMRQAARAAIAAERSAAKARTASLKAAKKQKR